MNKEEMMEQIMENMTAFTKTEFLRDELLPEYLKLQQDIVNLTFNEEHADRGSLRVWDVYSHLEKLNEERGNVADGALQKFKVSCDTLIDLIKAEISGNRGEQMAFHCLEGVQSQNQIITNAELSFDDLRTELDAVVVTSKGLFLVEVKNTKKDISIDEIGNYYRIGECVNLDSNIGEKMNLKERFLRRVVEEAGVLDAKNKLNVVKLVVFTNSRVKVENKFKYIQICYLSQLQYLIDDYDGEDLYSVDEMAAIAKAVEAAGEKEYYTADMDVERLKRNFAKVMVELENSSTENRVVEECVNDNTGKTVYSCENYVGNYIKPAFKVASAIVSVGALAVGVLAGVALGKRS